MPLSYLNRMLAFSLTLGRVPSHVAFIMDGNRRFARKQGIDRLLGHTLGFEKV